MLLNKLNLYSHIETRELSKINNLQIMIWFQVIPI